MEAMLADGNVMDKMVALKAKDNSLFMKMKQFFDNLLSKIRNVYKGLTPDSDEGKAVLEMTDSIEKLQQLFSEALVDASENFQSEKTQKNTTLIGGVDGEYDIKLSDREEMAYKQFSRKITSVINQSIAGKGNIDGKVQVVNIMPVGPKLAAMVAKSSSQAIDISNRYIALNTSDVWHEYKRHTAVSDEVSRDQVAFTKRQFQNAVKCMISPDMVETIFADANNPTQRQSFAYAKKTIRGHYVVVEAVGGKKNPYIYPVMIVQFSKSKWNKMIAEGKSLGEILHEGKTKKLLAQDVEKNKTSRVTAAQFASYEAIANTLHSPQLNAKVSQFEAEVKKNSDRDTDGTKFSMREPVEETKDLLAYHNITARLLTDVLNRNGLLMPSLAVTNKGMTDFGEISLLFDKSTIDPSANSENKLYGADAWTPTQTQLKKNAKFDIDRTVRAVNTMKNRIGSKYVPALLNITAKQFKDTIINADGSIYDAYAHNIGVQTAYAMERGIVSKIPTKQNGTVDKAALQEQLNRELDTDNGWRQYKKWLNNISDTVIASYDNATNEDILSNMKAQPATAKSFKLSENGELVVPAMEYASIDEIRRNKNRLSENAAEATKAVADEFLAFAREIGGDVKSVVNAINASFADRYSIADIVRSFNSKGIKISSEAASELQSLYKKAVELPTQYFEAKPGREVGLDEIKAVVMPAGDAYAELKGKLQDIGISVVAYDGSNKSRVEALNSVESLKFSDRDYNGPALAKAAAEHFGRTYGWKETGYLLTDGSKLDFSGRHEGASGGYRTVDHRQILDIYPEDTELDGNDAMVDFVRQGNIRIMPEGDGINLQVQPTKAQEQALADFISRARGEVTLDVDDANGNTVVSVEYPRGTRASKVLQDIRNYFEDGAEPVVSTVAQFRYSTRAAFYREFDAWDKKDTHISFKIGSTSNALLSTGMKNQNIILRSGTVLQKIKDHPEMTFEIFKGIPELLEHPVIVQFSDAIDPKTKRPKYDSSITVLGELYAEVKEDGKTAKKPVLVSLELLPTNQKKTAVLDFAIIKSAYSKNALQQYLNENSILYIDPDKKRTDSWLSLNRLQLPLGENRYGPIRKISYVDGKVKVQSPRNMTAMQQKMFEAGVIDEFGNKLNSDRTDESVSNRSLLANALEGVAQNETEKQKIKEYRDKVDLIDAEEAKLGELNRQIKELSFAKGPRDPGNIPADYCVENYGIARAWKAKILAIWAKSWLNFRRIYDTIYSYRYGRIAPKIANMYKAVTYCHQFQEVET